MEDSCRRSLLRRPDDSFDSPGQSFQDHRSLGNTSNEIDECCRLCCRENCNLRELFPGGYRQELLLRKIYDCTTVQITYMEDFDAMICHDCIGRIEEFFQYRELCRTNDVLQRKWKRRLGRSLATTSTLIPTISVKKEAEEYFGPTELVSLDTLEAAECVSSNSFLPVADVSMNQTAYSEVNVNHTGQDDPMEQEEHNLLELLPQPPDDMLAGDDKNLIKKIDERSVRDEDESPMQIKQEPEDINDSHASDEMIDSEDDAVDIGENDDTSSKNTALIPVIEGTSEVYDEACVVNQNYSVEERTRKNVVHCGYDYKMIKNCNNRIRLLADGHTFVRDRKQQDGAVAWRCRRNYDSCCASALQYKDGRVDVFGLHDHLPCNKPDLDADAKGTFAYKYVTTYRGKALILDGYRYHKFYNRVDGTTLWRCTNTPHCKIKASIEKDGKAYVTEEHQHERTEPPVSKEDIERNQRRNNALATSASQIVDEPVRKGAEVKGNTFKLRPLQVKAPKIKSKCSAVLLKKTNDFKIIRNKKGFQALLYKGYRYCKVRVLQDGSIKWLCKMNRKTCKAGLYLHPDGKIEWLAHSQHNHGPVQQDEHATTRKMSSGRRNFHIDEATFVSSEWYFVRNKKNGITLIHAGYRYNKKSDRADSSSLWRCSRVNAGCHAGVLMFPNETIARFSDIDHNHGPPCVSATEQPILEEESKNDQRNDADGNEDDLSCTSSKNQDKTSENLPDGFLTEHDDPEVNMRSLLSLMLHDAEDDKAEPAADSCRVVSATEAGYSFIKNRIHTRSLLFQGYRYCKNNPRADGSITWICQMNRKTCRASVKTLQDGSLVLINTEHNHSKLAEDDYDDNDDSADATAGTSTINQDNTNIADDPHLDDYAGSTNTGLSEQKDSSIAMKQPETKPCSDLEFKSPRKTKFHDYYYAINRSNRECLIYQQCRYGKYNERSDGSTVWRCCMAGGTCPATAVVSTDGKCDSLSDKVHNHAPLSILPPAARYPGSRSSPPSSKEHAKAIDSTITSINTMVYKGYRFKKIKDLPENVTQYECAEMEACLASVSTKQHRDYGKAEVIYESPHNHQPINVQSKVQSEQAPAHSPPAKSFPADDGTFQLFKTSRGQLTLTYNGYRFSLRNRQVNGTTAWKCRANKMCNAQIYISKEGTLIGRKEDYVSHNHDENANSVCSSNYILMRGKEVSNFCEFVLQCFSDIKNSSLAPTPVPGAMRTIEYDSHMYTLRAVKANGREYWRCTQFQAKACRAALFCRNNGKIVEYTNGQPHMHKPIPCRYTPPASKSADVTNPQPSRHMLVMEDGKKSGSETAKISKPMARTVKNPVGISTNGTRNFELINGRKNDLISWRGFRYCLKYKRQDGFSFYRCLRNNLHCPVTIKMDPTKALIFPHLGKEHNHGPDPSNKPVELKPRRRVEPDAMAEVADNQGTLHISQKQSTLHTEALTPKDDGGDECVDYSFLKSLDDNFLLRYQRFVYEFDGWKPNPYGGTSCKHYKCQTVNCEAKLCLLDSGHVKELQPNHASHCVQPKTLENVEDLGRGSKDFQLLSSIAGPQILVYQGNWYCKYHSARCREDGSSRWYCQSALDCLQDETKGGEAGRRCFVPLAMLPNGKVSTIREHQHPPCSIYEGGNTFLLHEDHRYKFQRNLPNQSSVWGCADHPLCSALIYRLKNGRLQTSRAVHNPRKGKVNTLSRPSDLRILNGTPLVTIARQVTQPPGSFVPSVPIEEFEKTYGRRSFWYCGNRYYFYLNRSDGKQYWRCSMRTTSRKCRAGLLRLHDGTIVAYSDETHSHPDQMANKSDPVIPVFSPPIANKHEFLATRTGETAFKFTSMSSSVTEIVPAKMETVSKHCMRRRSTESLEIEDPDDFLSDDIIHEARAISTPFKRIRLELSPQQLVENSKEKATDVAPDTTDAGEMEATNDTDENRSCLPGNAPQPIHYESPDDAEQEVVDDACVHTRQHEQHDAGESNSVGATENDVPNDGYKTQSIHGSKEDVIVSIEP